MRIRCVPLQGQLKHLQAGDVLAEVVNTAPTSRNLGIEPVKIIVFYTGVVSNTLTITQL